jgi:uncharacterized protein (DUF779 family)
MATESAKADTTAAAEISNPPQQVLTTPAAVALMETLRAKYGPLMFHQSGGCCDGSSPMCYPLGEFMTGDGDVLLATIGYDEDSAGAPFYMSKPQFEYWKHTQLILDVVPGRGGMFSLDNSEGVRFLIRSRVFTDEEIGELRAAGRI